MKDSSSPELIRALADLRGARTLSEFEALARVVPLLCRTAIGKQALAECDYIRHKRLKGTPPAGHFAVIFLQRFSALLKESLSTPENDPFFMVAAMLAQANAEPDPVKADKIRNKAMVVCSEIVLRDSSRTQAAIERKFITTKQGRDNPAVEVDYWIWPRYWGEPMTESMLQHATGVSRRTLNSFLLRHAKNARRKDGRGYFYPPRVCREVLREWLTNTRWNRLQLVRQKHNLRRVLEEAAFDEQLSEFKDFLAKPISNAGLSAWVQELERRPT